MFVIKCKVLKPLPLYTGLSSHIYPWKPLFFLLLLLVFNMINKLKRFNLIFLHPLELFGVDSRPHLSAKYRSFGHFESSGSTCTMTLTRPCVISLTFLGYGQALHVFITFRERLSSDSSTFNAFKGTGDNLSLKTFTLHFKKF